MFIQAPPTTFLHALWSSGHSPTKEALINIAEEFHKHGKLYPHIEDFEKIKKRHTRETIQAWTDMVLDSVAKNECVLIVDDLSDITPSVGRLIDKLNRKYIIIAAPREMKKTYEKHFWKFDRIEIEPLSTPEAKKLIRQCTAGTDIEDYRMTETSILQQSAGNPRAIIEIVERLRKEPAVTRSTVRHVSSFFSLPLHRNLPAIACAIIGSVLPDIDSPRSYIGRVLPFASIPIEKQWGHRTITHSLLCPSPSAAYADYRQADTETILTFEGRWRHTREHMRGESVILDARPTMFWIIYNG